jgi:UDP-N-acetylmuramate: L-alanyl-gamma-D-glutamyl-meso-diaminopimelate ligase
VAERILPNEMGWFAEKNYRRFILRNLGMHARVDNLGWQKSQQLGIKIYSYPEFVFAKVSHKRQVVYGVHGRNLSIPSMILRIEVS